MRTPTSSARVRLSTTTSAVAAAAAAAAAALTVAVACSSCSSASSSNDAPVPDAGADSGEPDAPGAGDGGGDGGPGVLLPRGGSRLVARYDETADGARVFADAFDKKLGVVCSAALTADGRIRCVPESGRTATPFFADAACAVAVVAEPASSCETSPYAQVSQPGANVCAPITKIMAVSATPAATLFQRGAGGACVAASPAPGIEYRALGAELPPMELVSFSLANDVAGGGVSVRVLVGDDGSRFTFQDLLFDDARGKLCAIDVASDGKPRCLPLAGARAGGFADGACTTPVAVPNECVPIGFELEPGLVSAGTGALGPCGGGLTTIVSSLGAKRPTRVIHYGSPASCSAALTSATDVFDLGAEVPPSTFPLLAPRATIGGARIVEDAYAVGPAAIGAVHLRDLALGVECSFSPAKDGAVRCLPSGAVLSGFHSDDKCTVPVADGNEDCSVPKHVRKSEGTGCGAAIGVYTLGARAELATTPLYVKDAGVPAGCKPFVGVSSSKYVWAIGAEVAPSSFVEGKLVER